jgi:hypothetical protein
MNYFYDLEHPWAIAAYEKNGREYKEIGILFEDSMMPVEAFEMMAQFCNAIPTFQVVHHALELEKNDPSASTPSYEVRLIDKTTKRVVISILWESHVIDLCKEDYKSKNLKTYQLLAEVDLADEDNIDEVDLSLLSLSGNFRIVDMALVDEVEFEEEDGEEPQ